MSDSEAIRQQMRNIVQMIAFLPLEGMNEAVEEAQQSRQYWDSLGSMVDPTRYRDMLYDGTLEHADTQTEIAKHLIHIRELVDKLDGLSAKHRKQKQEDV